MLRDVSQGYNKVSGCFAGLQQGFRMLRKVTIRLQDASKGCNSLLDVSQGVKQGLNGDGNALMVM